MPRWSLFALAAVADFVAAYWFFVNGRIVVPAILVLAGVCFVMAALGAAKKTGVPS